MGKIIPFGRVRIVRYEIKTLNQYVATSELINLINECDNLELKSVSNIQLIRHLDGVALYKISHLYPYLEPKLKEYLDEKFNKTTND
jgi:hypothetical protein